MQQFALKTLPILLVGSMTALTAQADPWIESGIAAASMDVTHLVRQSVDKRATSVLTTERADGGAVWLDLTGTDSRSDTVADGVGYRNKVAAANLGADIRYGDAFFGVVYTFAHVDGESRGAASASEAETQWFGVHVFGERSFGALALAGQFGWLHSHGQGKGEGGSLAMHSNVYSFDLAARLALAVGQTHVVPYVKVENTVIDQRNWRDGYPNRMTVHQFPVGVNVSRTFSSGEWTIRPEADAAIVCTAGDTEAVRRENGLNRSTRWIDDSTLWRGRLGLTAQKEHASYGLQYEYQTSSGGRRAHQVQLEGQYSF